jgi:hypothetical protein
MSYLFEIKLHTLRESTLIEKILYVLLDLFSNVLNDSLGLDVSFNAHVKHPKYLIHIFRYGCTRAA